MSSTSGGGRASGDQRPPIPVTPDFDAFVVRNEQALFLYLRRLLSSDEGARDTAQEAFFRAWTHFESIRTYDRPDAWLFRVATNLALSSLRRREAHTATPANVAGASQNLPASAGGVSEQPSSAA